MSHLSCSFVWTRKSASVLYLEILSSSCLGRWGWRPGGGSIGKMPPGWCSDGLVRCGVAACYPRAKARGDPAANQPVAAPTRRQLRDRTPGPTFTPADRGRHSLQLTVLVTDNMKDGHARRSGRNPLIDRSGCFRRVRETPINQYNECHTSLSSTPTDQTMEVAQSSCENTHYGGCFALHLPRSRSRSSGDRRFESVYIENTICRWKFGREHKGVLEFRGRECQDLL